ncbi:hypothetical protein GQ55_9G492100 [Panicum hallii var. hallii]|uniref:Uncharacterized protein n=1 Tax=Panicum hallii var. hallii TaxID=1504633 RepID=A0A2T7CD73_9POAL|nr:hypothetical protein GQ55_9G492100 [Panicum hallii var. hallii]
MCHLVPKSCRGKSNTIDCIQILSGFAKIKNLTGIIFRKQLVRVVQTSSIVLCTLLFCEACLLPFRGSGSPLPGCFRESLHLQVTSFPCSIHYGRRARARDPAAGKGITKSDVDKAGGGESRAFFFFLRGQR